MIVCKFGGTSVQDAEAVRRVAGIIKARLKDKPVVVASAMGKTTNGLLQAAETAARGKRQEALDLLGKIRERHYRETQKLLSVSAKAAVMESLGAHLQELTTLLKNLTIRGELTPRSMDAVASFGERVPTLILA